MIASGALWLKFVLSGFIQANKGFKAAARMPEDKIAGIIVEKPDENAIVAHTRWSKIIQNDIENIPLGLILNWGSLLCNANPAYHLGLNCL